MNKPSKSVQEERTRVSYEQTDARGNPAREEVGQEGNVYRLRCRRCGSSEFDLGARLRCEVCGLSMPIARP